MKSTADSNASDIPPPLPPKQQTGLSLLQQKNSSPLMTVHSLHSETTNLISPEVPVEPTVAKTYFPKDEPNNNIEQNVSPPEPNVILRPGVRGPIGTRVFPVLDPNRETPPVKLRRFQPVEKKSSTKRNFEEKNQTNFVCFCSAEISASGEMVSTGAETNADNDEQYKSSLNNKRI